MSFDPNILIAFACFLIAAWLYVIRVFVDFKNDEKGRYSKEDNSQELRGMRVEDMDMKKFYKAAKKVRKQYEISEKNK